MHSDVMFYLMAQQTNAAACLKQTILMFEGRLTKNYMYIEESEHKVPS